MNNESTPPISPINPELIDQAQRFNLEINGLIQQAPPKEETTSRFSLIDPTTWSSVISTIREIYNRFSTTPEQAQIHSKLNELQTGMKESTQEILDIQKNIGAITKNPAPSAHHVAQLNDLKKRLEEAYTSYESLSKELNNITSKLAGHETLAKAKPIKNLKISQQKLAERITEALTNSGLSPELQKLKDLSAQLKAIEMKMTLEQFGPSFSMTNDLDVKNEFKEIAAELQSIEKMQHGSIEGLVKQEAAKLRERLHEVYQYSGMGDPLQYVDQTRFQQEGAKVKEFNTGLQKGLKLTKHEQQMAQLILSKVSSDQILDRHKYRAQLAQMTSSHVNTLIDKIEQAKDPLVKFELEEELRFFAGENNPFSLVQQINSKLPDGLRLSVTEQLSAWRILSGLNDLQFERFHSDLQEPMPGERALANLKSSARSQKDDLFSEQEPNPEKIAFLREAENIFESKLEELYQANLQRSPKEIQELMHEMMDMLGPHFQVPASHKLFFLELLKKKSQQYRNMIGDWKPLHSAILENLEEGIPPIINVEVSKNFSDLSPGFMSETNGNKQELEAHTFFSNTLLAKQGFAMNTQDITDSMRYQLFLDVPNQRGEKRFVDIIEKANKNKDHHSPEEKDLIQNGYYFRNNSNLWVRTTWDFPADLNPFTAQGTIGYAIAGQPRSEEKFTLDLSEMGDLSTEQKKAAIRFTQEYSSLNIEQRRNFVENVDQLNEHFDMGQIETLIKQTKEFVRQSDLAIFKAFMNVGKK